MRKSPTGLSALLTMLLCSAVLSGCDDASGKSADSGNPAAAAPVILAQTMVSMPATGGRPAQLPPSTVAGAAQPAGTPPATTPPPVVLAPPPPRGAPPAGTPPPPAAPVTPPPVMPPANANSITDVRLQNLQKQDQNGVAVTFGQVFAPGQVPAGQSITGKLADGSALALQVDVKARHADGSVRHAIVSAKLARLSGGQTSLLLLERTSAGAAVAPGTPAALLEAGFSAAVHADLDGQRYSASADALLRSGKYTSWLAGPVANEWLLSGPLTTSAGKAHPHLSARFAIRAYGNKQARVDVTVENDWAFEPNPQNFRYDAQVMVGGHSVYTKNNLNHLNHARWRKVFWWGTEPALHIKHNTAYLIATRAVPNYDQSVKFSEARLAGWEAALTSARSEPMAVGLANPYMPTTGGRDDLGIMPGWSATYLLSMDKRLKDVTLATADLAGSWSAHYRDKQTGRPVSLADYPAMTVLGHEADTLNVLTKKWEAFPVCASATGCATPNMHDSSHQAGFAYLPYLVTGDYYYLEELQFWAMWNTFSSNPGYREFGKGLFKSDQVRGQAWSMRTLAEAAYISPDTDPLKKQLDSFLQNNIDWYNARYVTGSDNVLGVVTNGYAVEYNNGTGLAPWMDDFFTSAIGHTVDLGYKNALPLLKWKAKFPISRMTDKQFCWIKAGIYALKVRDKSGVPFYSSIGQAYRASNDAQFNTLACNSSAMAASLGQKVGEMTGYAGVHTGYPSNLQPALAYAADVGGSSGAAAWSVFMGRSVKPHYGEGPQFAIVPR
ncbi:hypothetical protein [Massilia sp. TWP1-3-3]|uniref:RIFT barrel domain-containing protein n=1 Tax=Massilia sp. TWP1-3-3 TaxID=2804573 RepID=UPI003CEF9E2C